MYTIYCSYSRYDELCQAMCQLDIDDPVKIEAVSWLPHGTVTVKFGKEQQTWDVDFQVQTTESLNEH